MHLPTYQVTVGGKCDWCPNMFDEGDFVGELPDGTLMCPDCVTNSREAEGAA